MVQGVDFSPSGQRVITSGYDKTVRLWDVATAKELHRFEGHTGWVERVAYAPDGRHALAASFDRTLRLWRLPAEDATGESNNPATPPDCRTPIPDIEALAEAAKSFRDLYKDDYAKTRHSELSAFAMRLMEVGRDEKKNLALRFALLAEARDVAAKAADGTLAFKAIEELALDFAVDEREMKGAALQTAIKEVATPERSALLAEATLGVAEEAVAADSLDEAIRLAKFAENAAFKSKDNSLATSVQARRQEMELLNKEFEGLLPAVKVLAENPEEPDANLKLGRYLCLLEGDWTRGLPHLAKGGDGRLQELATIELADPQTAEAQTELADGWRDLASKERGLSHIQLLRHACNLYRKALPNLNLVAKASVEKRLDELEKQMPIDRLDDPFLKFKGRWTVRCEDRTVLEYVIDALGNVTLARQFRIDAKGNASEISEPNRPGKLIKEASDILMDFNDGKVNRIRLRSGKLYLEHFFPRQNYPNKKPYTTGTGTKK